MNQPITNSWIAVEHIGTAVVMKMPAGKLYHDEEIDLIGEALRRLIATADCTRFVMDFHAVDRISSELLGVLIVAQKRVIARGCQFVLCALNAELREVFGTLRLDRVFTIVADVQAALTEPAGS